MKAWQLTTVLAVVAIAAGQIPLREDSDDTLPIRARLDRVVSSSTHGSVGPEDDRPVLDLDEVDAAIRGQRSVKVCFWEAQRELGHLPDVVVRFRIEDGKVDSARIDDPATLQGSALDACLALAFQSMQFASEPHGGVWLNYPFKF